eukprot:GHVT01046733.1.p1 GENE.GHVT01046733.1~~GHVT01046733.1.p1  ORF type:complete len:248 (+),score=35.45 GHVT01046733.1:44-745(+)
MGLDGTLSGRLMKRFSPSFEVKSTFQSSLSEEQSNVYEVSLDNMGKDWASSVKFVWQGCWVLNGMLSQVITKNLQLGGELTWIAANGASMGAVGARWASERDIFTGTLNRLPDFKSPRGLTNQVHSLRMQYVRKVTPRLAMASELEVSDNDYDSSMKVGWQYLFRHARVQGQIDTGGRVSMFAEDFSGFGVSGTIDFWRGDYRFGFMMHVLPPPENAQQGSPPPGSSGGMNMF